MKIINPGERILLFLFVPKNDCHTDA